MGFVMNYSQTRVYCVSLSYIKADGERSFSYYEVPADSEYEAIQYVRGQWHREHLFATYEPDVSARLLYTDYWSVL